MITPVAVVGVGTTDFGALGRTADDLAGEALRNALGDAGLSVADVDGLLTHRVDSYEALAAEHGLDPRWTVPLPPEGRMTGPALQLAAAALREGARLVATLIGLSAEDLLETRIGQAVTAKIDAHREPPRVVFRPAPEGAAP